MLLSVKKSYLLTTLQKTIIKKKVKIVAITDYDEASAVAYNINNLAINEKIIPSDTENADYLKNLIYYKAAVLKDDNAKEETGEYIIFWDDIIDSSSTTELFLDYNLTSTVSINPNSSIAISEIVDKINTYIKSTYNNNVSISISIKNTTSSNIESKTEKAINELSQMESYLTEAMNTLSNLISLNTSTDNLINKINELSLSTNLTDLETNVEQIKTIVNQIYYAIK